MLDTSALNFKELTFTQHSGGRRLFGLLFENPEEDVAMFEKLDQELMAAKGIGVRSRI